MVVTALGFDFTNGFHDTGNAMATSIATGALRPRIAVALSAVLNLVGAFLSVEVALTVTNAVVKIQDSSGAPKADLVGNGGAPLVREQALQEASEDDVRRVSARLAGAGWPLSDKVD